MSRPQPIAGDKWSPVLLRLAVGIVLLISGIGKLFTVGPKASGIGEFAGLLASLGVPGPTIVAWLVALGETGGGVLLLLGVLTRYAATVAAATMFAAMTLVHLPNGFANGNGGIEYTLVLFLVAIAIVLSGPGALSIERQLFGNELFIPFDGQTDGNPVKDRLSDE
jgi:putative oxidoreductase